MKNIKAIIFDWGRVIWNPEKDFISSEVLQIIIEMKKLGLKIYIASLAPDSKSRKRKILASSVANYIDGVETAISQPSKSALYDLMVKKYNLIPTNCIIIDDQWKKAVGWVKKNNSSLIWVKIGKFANILPTETEEKPNFTVGSMKELLGLLKTLL